MGILVYHHKELVSFLKEVRDTTPEFSFIALNSPERKLLNIIIDAEGGLVKQGKAAESINIQAPYLRRKVQLKLNMMLEAFSGKCGITPPIQLFFITRGSYDGGHFACCKVKIGESQSENFIRLEDLQKLIGEARRGLGLISGTQKLKYLRDMRDVLRWNDEAESAQWFRKGGPIAADFRSGYVYERKEILGQLKALVSQNTFSMLVGDGGTGKSVLVRNLAYSFINEDEKRLIYHYSFKTDMQIVDFHEFLSFLGNLTGIVIIEDVHLAAQDIQRIFLQIEKQNQCHFLLTSRPSYQKTLLFDISEGFEKIPKLVLTFHVGARQDEGTDEAQNYGLLKYMDNTDDDVDTSDDTLAIANRYFCANNRDIDFWRTFKYHIKALAEKNLWLLSYALEGYSPTSAPISWVRDGVRKNLKNIQNRGCKPELLVALSYLYAEEIPTARSFLIKNLHITSEDIYKALQAGEISEQEIDGISYYGLPHSALAKLYLEYGEDFRHSLEYQDVEEFIYNYAVCGTSNGLTAIVRSKFRISLLNRLASEKQILRIIDLEKNPNIYLFLARHILEPNSKLNFYYTSKEFTDIFMNLCFKKIDLSLLALRCRILCPNIYKLFWDSPKKELFIAQIYENDNFGAVCGYLKKISRTDASVKSDVLKVLDHNKLASKANNSNSLRQIMAALGLILEAAPETADSFWKKVNKDNLARLINNTAGSMYDTFLNIQLISEKNAMIGEEISALLDCDLLASSLNNQAKLPESTKAVSLLFKFNHATGMKIWHKTDKRHLADLVQQADQTCVYGFFYTLFNQNKTAGRELLDSYIDKIMLIKNFCKASNFFVFIPFLDLLIINHPKAAREIIEHIDSEEIEKLFIQKNDLYLSTELMLTIWKSKHKNNDALSELIKTTVNKCVADLLLGKKIFEINWIGSFIAEYDPVAANKLYMHMLNNIGLEKYITMIKSFCENEADNCYKLFSIVDPQDKQGWNQFLSSPPAS